MQLYIWREASVFESTETFKIVHIRARLVRKKLDRNIILHFIQPCLELMIRMCYTLSNNITMFVHRSSLARISPLTNAKRAKRKRKSYKGRPLASLLHHLCSCFTLPFCARCYLRLTLTGAMQTCPLGKKGSLCDHSSDKRTLVSVCPLCGRWTTPTWLP